MTLSDVSIQRPVFTWMLVMALVVFGVLGYSRLGVDQFPRMEFPVVTVTAILDGATPEGMEEDVTDVLEEHLNTIAGVRSLSSTSYHGAAQIRVEFDLGVDLDVATQDVRDEISQARRRLPPEADPPTVQKMGMGSFPVIWVPFNTSRPVVEASEYMKRNVRPLLETIPGVGGVDVFGDRERKIRIWLDGDALRARALAAQDVLAALRREHIDRPGGLVEGQQIEWSVKTDAEYRSIEDLEGLLIAQNDLAPVYLRDVARVEDGEEGARMLARFNGSPTVGISVRKQSDGNTVAIVAEVYRRLDALRPHLPDGISLEATDAGAFIDFSRSIIESVEETRFALVFGGLLAVLVVFVFLRRSRPTLIVAAAIPLSLIATFGLVWVFGYTLNTMTLLGLTLAIGVVIDDAIIVLENIERHREAGKPAFAAAREGTREITFAATAATISVAAVFLPVIFAEGIVGNFLGEFGLTVAASVIVSLFVALTLTPMLAARMPPPGERSAGSIYGRLEQGFAALEAGYRRALDLSLRHRTLTGAIAVAALVAAFGFGSRLGSEFFPSSDSGMIFTPFEIPPGGTVTATAEYLTHNESFFLAQPETAGQFAATGGQGSQGVRRANVGTLVTMLKPADQRERTSMEIIEAAREHLSRIPGQTVSVRDPSTMSGSGSKGEFEVVLRGNLALRDLDTYASRMIEELKALGGFVDLDKSMKLGLPEVRVVPDRRRAAALGVDAASIAESVQVMIGGMDVATFKEEGRRYDIRVRLEADERDTPEKIQNLYVRTRRGEVAELRNLVDVQLGAAASEITRTDRQRSVSVYGNLSGKPLGTAIREAREVGARILPDEITLTLSGQARSMQEGSSQFGLMLLLAILVIYMVLAAQFESFVHPLAVMLALPFSMVGALGGLWAMGMTLNLFSMIGIILLFGLVTKNSILLVDYANQLRDQGLEKSEAMRTAAPVRMRPVLMTAFSMIFGVLPAAFGLGPGSETRAPMAVATAAGMFSSMLLTLLVVPVFYLWLDDLAEWVRGRIFGRRSQSPAAPPVEATP